MLGLMQLGGALRNWMPAKTQKTARSVRIGQPAPHQRQEGRGKEIGSVSRAMRIHSNEPLAPSHTMAAQAIHHSQHPA